MKVVKGVLVVMKVERLLQNLYMLLGDILQNVEASIASTSQEEITMM